jgi:hypothetical protein
MKKTSLSIITFVIVFLGIGMKPNDVSAQVCGGLNQSCCVGNQNACNDASLTCTQATQTCITVGGGGPAPAQQPVVPNSINGSCGVGFIDTAIGCIPYGDQNSLIGFFLKWGLGIGGGIAFLLIVVAGFQITTSRGDPNRLKAGQELMTSAIAGLLLLIFSLIILNIIGGSIFNISFFQ